MRIEDRTARIGGVEIASQGFGDPGDRALVLVMGATASMLWWPEDMCRALASRGLFVVRYDNRDTGRSTTGAPGAPAYAVEDMAADLLGVIDTWRLDRADLAGMSLGGLIAQIAALQWPGRVRSLVLVAAEPLGWTGPALPGIAPAFLEHFRGFADLDWSDRGAVEAFLLEIARLSAGRGFPFEAERARLRIRGEAERARDFASAFNHGGLALAGDWSDRLRDLRQPVLILHGSQDPVVPPENAAALSKAIPHAHRVMLEGLGHELPAGVLGRMVDEIEAFLARMPPVA